MLTIRSEVLCRICTVQILPKKHDLYHAGHTTPTRYWELDDTGQEFIFPAWQMYTMSMGIGDPSDV